MGRKIKISDMFAAAYPHIARWIREEEGWIELGSDEFSSSFIRVLNRGGMIWEGTVEYKTIDDALTDADASIVEWLEAERPAKIAPAAKKKLTDTKKKPAGLKLVPVESRMLSAIGYDDETKELVAIYNSGAIWRYRGVPKKVYKELLASDSKGGYVRDLIIGAYPEYRASR